MWLRVISLLALSHFFVCVESVEVPPEFKAGCASRGQKALIWSFTSLLGARYEDFWTGMFLLNHMIKIHLSLNDYIL